MQYVFTRDNVIAQKKEVDVDGQFMYQVQRWINQQCHSDCSNVCAEHRAASGDPHGNALVVY